MDNDTTIKVEARNPVERWLSHLGLLLIGLKLTGHIAWPWWGVLSPVWAIVASWFLSIVVKAACDTIKEGRTHGRS